MLLGRERKAVDALTLRRYTGGKALIRRSKPQGIGAIRSKPLPWPERIDLEASGEGFNLIGSSRNHCSFQRSHTSYL